MSTTFSSPLILLAEGGSNAALVTFLLYTIAVFVLAGVANKLLQKKSFLSEYFLGSRSLGVWAFALTFAATSASGGSFTGFPAKIYTHGWVLGLWIGSYIVVPICAMGLLGKRINHVARISGAITVPDVLRDRFGSAWFGLLSVSLIVFFMAFNLVAQFKAGSLILKTLLQDVTMFHSAGAQFGQMTSGIGFLSGVDPEYLICLLAFGIAVVLYTTYGGFRAVVWTDVMQGVVMVVGVMIMLPIAIYLVGGLVNATAQNAQMVPPRHGEATVELRSTMRDDYPVPTGTWIALSEGDSAQRLFRVAKSTVVLAGKRSVTDVSILEIMSEGDIATVLKNSKIDDRLTVVDVKTTPYAYGDGQKGVYVTGPGPSNRDGFGFLPLSLAISFFFMWAISGAGQPSSMVRLMAFKDSKTLKRSIFTVAIYYSMIYFPLVIIFCCARVLMPGMEVEPDRIMPAMAIHLTAKIGMGWLAGLLIAAPFAAVMSTVDSFLLMISSALVRDIYQRNINPAATEKTVKKLSYLFTMLVGTGALLGAVNPPRFLQDIIVYTGSGLAACFLGPMVFALYWPRANSRGCMAGMIAGFLAHLSMYVAGFLFYQRFTPYRLFNLDPIVVGLFVSFASVYIVTKLTPPPSEEIVRKYFCKPKSE